MKIFIYLCLKVLSLIIKKEKNIAPSPQGTPLTNKKENKNPLPPCAPGQKLIFLNLFDCNENSYIYVWKSYL